MDSHFLCHQPSGEDIVQRSAAYPIHVWLLDASGTRYEELPRGRDGTFAVPDGARYLFQFRDHYYETDRRALDYVDEFQRRCEPAPANTSQPTPIGLTVAKTDTFTAGEDVIDSITIQSFAALYTFGYVPYAVARDGAAIATAIDWPAFSLVVDARYGDDFEVRHARLETVREPAFRREAQLERLRARYAPTVTLHDGEPLALAGSFEKLPMNRSLSFTNDRAQFDADYAGRVRPGRMSVAVLAAPAMYGAAGVPLVQLELWRPDFDSSGTNAQPWTFTNLSYADPYPATWKRTLLVDYLMSRGFRHPASSAPTSWLAVNQQRVPFTGTIAPGPTLHPPTEPRLGDIDLLAGGNIAFDGTTPIAARWTSVDGANYYELTIIELLADGGIRSVATLRTTETKLAIPAQLLTAGAFYIVTLAATAAPSGYREGRIVAYESQSNTASVISGRLRFSATCGDGIVQLGEDCDTAGESTTCNVDCTQPRCGDGLRNAAAGEACDNGEDTIGCDRDCTLPQCGDNLVNLAVEDCDDGDDVDTGNGCSADCKLAYTCGNRRVERGESCDEGGLDTERCDADCSGAQCGDGYVNAAAGEACDEGRLNSDAGHCTTTCHLQP